MTRTWERRTNAVVTSTSDARLSVAVDVTALSTGPAAAAEFVRFALAACSTDRGLIPERWATTWMPRSRRSSGAAAPSRAALARAIATLGLRISTRRTTPRADVVFLASGQRSLQAKAPAVVTVLGAAEWGEGRSRAGRRRRELLRRAADGGAFVHATTQAVADEVVDVAGVPRSQVVVAAPGIETPVDDARPSFEGRHAVIVLRGDAPQRDHATCDLLRSAGVPASLAPVTTTLSSARCAVLASPSAGFPVDAMRAMATGVPVVATRTATTTELLEGAATLVDPQAPEDLVDAVVQFVRDETARTVAVAAGRTRASDFTWSSRATDVTELLRRAVAMR